MAAMPMTLNDLEGHVCWLKRSWLGGLPYLVKNSTNLLTQRLARSFSPCCRRVCPYITSRYCTKTTKRRITQTR